MVSAIGDNFKDQFPHKWPNISPSSPFLPSEVSKSDFDALRKEVEELKKLLVAAKKFDEATGQPHCEIDDKVKLIKRIAELVGVDLGDVFDAAKPKAKKRKP